LFTEFYLKVSVRSRGTHCCSQGNSCHSTDSCGCMNSCQGCTHSCTCRREL